MASTWSLALLISLGMIGYALVAAGKKRRNRESSSTWWPSSGINYEVFLNFRGLDTRRGFTDLLHRKLTNAGIKVFKDDKNLCAGEEINQGLKDAIKRSRISIAIFSKDYASSKSCLMELEHMWKCKELDGQIIIPIFYDVTPYDVKHQTGHFATSFEKHNADEKVDSDTIKTWEDVLGKVADLVGYELKNINSGNVCDLLHKVHTRVTEVLRKDDQVVTDEPVGIDLHVQEMMTKLGVVYSHGQATKVCGQDVRVVGICGVPGVGKSTLAKVVFNKIYKLFDQHCFVEVENLEGVFDRKFILKEVKRSQEQLIAGLQNEKCEPLKSPDEGTKIIGSRFSNMKVLIVLDNVREVEQIKRLVGDLSWFGSGSRIIVITDRINILDGFKDETAQRAVKEHKVKPMESHHALQLFHKHASRGGAAQDVSEYDSLSVKIVNAIGGLPLAIEITASHLSINGKNSEIWKETLKSLEKNQKNTVKDAFMESYNSLDAPTKEIFLDVACFFIGKDRRIPSYMWKACDFAPATGIKRLSDMHLLEIGENSELRMHDLLRDFGRQLVKDKGPRERCRFWNHSDALSILEDDKGTQSVIGIGLTFEDDRTACFTCEQFRQISNLRYLRLDRANIEGNTDDLLPNMRWLDWRACHLISQLGNMHLKELVILDLSWSPVTKVSEFWEQIMKKVEKLEVLNLQGCVQLHASLNFPAPVNLEMLILEDCKLLSKIRPFIRELKKLTSLNLRNCSQVKELPQELYCMESLTELLLDGTGIRGIHCQEGSLKNLQILSARKCKNLRNISKIGHLKELSSLSLDGADIDGLPDAIMFLQKLRGLSLKKCPKLVELPTSIGKLEKLEVMDLSRTKITKLPESVKDLRNLKTLKMAESFLREFPKDIVNLKNLEEMDFSLCRSLESSVRSDISGLSSLRILKLSASNVVGLPKSICHLSCLQILDIRKCNQLHALPKLPSSLLCLRWGSKKMTITDLSDLTNLKELLLTDGEQPNAGWIMMLLNLMTPNIGWITRLPSLETLELSLSKVTYLPGNFSALTHLRELTLSYMEKLDITQLPSSSLLSLRLKYCRIRKPKISGLIYLSELELDHCDLAEIDGLEDLKLLEVLIISHCRTITSLNGLKDLPRLRKVEGTFAARPSLPKFSHPVELDIFPRDPSE